MEFLMTYGWAILIVVIAVAALAAFGVFSPERFAQERCVGDSTKFACATAQVAVDTTANNVSFELTNGAGNEVSITSVRASGEGDCHTDSTTDLTYSLSPAGNQSPNDDFIVTVTCPSGVSEGGVFQDTFRLNYDIVDGLTGLNGRVEVVVKP